MSKHQEEARKRHYAELDAADKIATRASIMSLETGKPYEQCQKIVMAQSPELAKVYSHGESEEDWQHPFTYSRYEADKELDKRVRRRMAEKGESFDIAYAKVFADPANSELVRCYVHNDK